MKNVDDGFYKRADAHIHLSNEQKNEEIGCGKVSASFLFGAARYNAFVRATECGSSDEMASSKIEALEYFVSEYRKALEENYDDYIDNFEKYMGKQE